MWLRCAALPCSVSVSHPPAQHPSPHRYKWDLQASSPTVDTGRVHGRKRRTAAHCTDCTSGYGWKGEGEGAEWPGGERAIRPSRGSHTSEGCERRISVWAAAAQAESEVCWERLTMGAECSWKGEGSSGIRSAAGAHVLAGRASAPGARDQRGGATTLEVKH